MKLDVKQGEGLKRQLLIELSAETVNSEMDTQFMEKRKHASLKGFRKGKAPIAMIKSIYKEEVTIEAADNLIKNSYPDALRESKLKVATPPQVSALDFTEDGRMTYTADIEVFPDISPVKFDGLKVVDAKPEVTDENVNEICDLYLNQFSETKDVDRAAKDNDVIVADLKKLDDPKGIMKDDLFEGVEIDLAKAQVVKEFKEQLPGSKAGDEKEIAVVYADDYTDARFAGATIKYLCKVNSVKERILPEFNDAFAKQTGQAETALELKLKIREQLATEGEDNHRNSLKQQTISQLIEKNKFDLPEAMVTEYLDAAVKDNKEKYPDASEEEIRKSYREPGMNQMRWNFLYHELSEQEKIEVLPSDTEKWIEGFAESNKVTIEQAKQVLAQDNRVRNLTESLLEEKVLDFLLEKADKTAK